jgi:hypothetical protein
MTGQEQKQDQEQKQSRRGERRPAMLQKKAAG